VGLTNVNVFGGSDVGGLVGKNTGNISNVYITGTVIDVNTTAGGLVGQNSGGNIGNSYAAVSVSGGGGLGGLVGKNTGSISNSFATGSVSGSAGFVGGLVGFNTAPLQQLLGHTDERTGYQCRRHRPDHGTDERRCQLQQLGHSGSLVPERQARRRRCCAAS
jgi:hypothetical protein